MPETTPLSYSSFPRLVAIECSDDGAMELFERGRSGQVRAFSGDFRPWLLAADAQLASMLAGSYAIEDLDGEGSMRSIVFFPDRGAYDAAVKQLREMTGLAPSSPNAPYRIFSDLVQQAMILQRLRLFHDLDFEELVRLQLDIECHSGDPQRFCDAARAEDVITLISLKTSTGREECLSLDECGGEKALLQRAFELIRQCDPDVIEGHNLCNFDFDYIEKRCRRHRIPFAIGRGGRPATSRPSVINIAEKRINYRRWNVYGRHVVDTYHLVQLADVSRRDMESYSLKYCARYYGIARPGRVYVDGAQISRMYQEEPARLKEYCLDDVRETDGLSRLLSPSWFYQTRLLPLSYQSCVVRGNATRIDAMLCAGYLTMRHALPRPKPSFPYEGALTEATRTGVFSPVWHIDVRSLYPSVILANGWTPSSDPLGLFLEQLRTLRDFRLAAKDAARKAAANGRREHFNALQASFKILINSFYGYLGFAQGTFNDYAMAANVTAAGRKILSTMNEELKKEGASVVEMDTDGIYFVPPGDADTPDAMRERIQRALPDGIEIELDGIYDAIFCYKSKNYALKETDGQIRLHGAALRSRGLEPFQRRFVREAVALRLDRQDDKLKPLYEKYRDDIENHRLPLEDFMKREFLTQNVDAYRKALSSGKGRRAAAYELAARSRHELKSGDAVTYYVTGGKKSVAVADFAKLKEESDPAVRDENIPFYLDKLKGLYDKFLDS